MSTYRKHLVITIYVGAVIACTIPRAHHEQEGLVYRHPDHGAEEFYSVDALRESPYRTQVTSGPAVSIAPFNLTRWP